ncbi:MAG: helix-turn-helix domain-containing protein [Rhodospirillales bacterium]|nr:helix-turn-helix domain-containing protein [Rhodospirillales bacterium]
MSHMQEQADSSFAESALAERLRREREERGWSLADLASRAGVSRAMISRIERAEASPTAVLLARLAAAFGLSLSALLARVEADSQGPQRVRRRAEQPLWRDPQTGYIRRAVSPEGTPELTHVELPPGARVAYPAAACLDVRGQCLWVLAGRLDFSEGEQMYRLDSGDCIALGHPADRVYANASEQVSCHYLLAVVRA